MSTGSNTVVRSGALALIGLVVSGAFQLLLILAATRGLGAAAAGLFFEAVALFTILNRVGELGASTGLVRTVSRFRALGRTGDLRTTLLVAVLPVALFGLLMGSATYAFAPQLGAIFFDAAHEAEATRLIRLLAPLVPLGSAVTVALAATRGFGTMTPYVGVQNVALPLVRLALVVAAIAAGLGAIAVGLAWAAPVAIAFVVAAVCLLRLVRRAELSDEVEYIFARSDGDEEALVVRRTPRALAREFWNFSAPRGLAGMLGIAVTWMDVLLVGALRSTREAAIYAAASRLAIVGAYALQAIGMAIAPRVSALLAKGDGPRVAELYRSATWSLMGLTWPLYIALAVFAPYVMGAFGPEFVAGQTALVVLCLAMLVNLATGNVTTVLLMGGKSSWNLFNAATSLALNVTLNLILTPRMGITGAAIAWAASIVFVNVAPLVQVGIFMRLKPPFGTGFVAVAVASIACYGGIGLAVREVLGTSAATLAGYAAVATVVYLATLWRLRDVLSIPDLLRSLRPKGRPGGPAQRVMTPETA
jgi:O-antigen/teichoic acid export membrane protein